MTARSPVVIAGAGIGGLTAALALARRGFDVEIVERAASLGEIGAGIQLSPNATGVLHALGLAEPLAAVAVEPAAIDIRSAGHGGTITTLPLGQAMVERYGAPFLVIHRGDLQAVLLDAAAADPRIRLHLGSEIAAVRQDEGSVEIDVRLPRGPATLSAEAVIGADGVRSAMRTQVLGGPPAAYTGRTAWRTTIPASEWRGDANVLRNTGLWLGAGAHMVHYPVRARREINVIVAVEEPWSEASHDLPGDPEALIARLAGWPVAARALVALSPEWRRWALSAVDPSGPWVRGRIALLGDAAHAMLPFAAQGGAMAIEDAWVLTSCLANRDGPVSARLAAYRSARRMRVASVVATARRNGAIYHLSGPAAAARDMTMRLLGSKRLLERMDWVYRWRDEI